MSKETEKPVDDGFDAMTEGILLKVRAGEEFYGAPLEKPVNHVMAPIPESESSWEELNRKLDSLKDEKSASFDIEKLIGDVEQGEKFAVEGEAPQKKR